MVPVKVSKPGDVDSIIKKCNRPEINYQSFNIKVMKRPKHNFNTGLSPGDLLPVPFTPFFIPEGSLKTDQ
jgi:hypothetical protein